MRNQGTVWIPESPMVRGLFAGQTVLATNVIEQAIQFDSYQKCFIWCTANRGQGVAPCFEPVMHRFGTSHIAVAK